MTKKQRDRIHRLLPGGTPKYVRIYDAGDTEHDRFTIVFSGNYNNIGCGRGDVKNNSHFYTALGTYPSTYCQHGETQNKCCDVNKSGFAPAIGRKNHLGKRIPFLELNDACKEIVLREYIGVWSLEFEIVAIMDMMKASHENNT